jgi:HD-like signal output (HDOD) protein
MDRRAGSPETPLTEIEREEFGVTHARVGAAALGVMRFPADVVEAIAEHHSPPGQVAPLLGRLLIAAGAIALEVDGIDSEDNASIEEALDSLGMAASAGDDLIDEVRRDQENLGRFN